jgi:predicted SAM-dependent methyltransferase
VGRDYGDTRTLYVDMDAPSGGVPHPDFPQVVVFDDGLKFLVCQAPPLPFADGAVSQVFAEHLIEHLTPREGRLLCSEMRRVLRPGGLLRMSTPDLALFAELYQAARSGRGDRDRARMLQEIARVDPSLHEYVVGQVQPWTPSPAFILNHIFRLWGHEWIYDTDELTDLLVSAGFDRASVTLRSFRVGASPGLARQDLEYRRTESFYLEAVRA